MQTVTFPAPPRSDSTRSNDKTAQRKPSPLHVSHVSSPITQSFAETRTQAIESPTSSKGGRSGISPPSKPSFDGSIVEHQPRSPPVVGRSPVLRHGSNDSVTVPDILTPRAAPQRNASAPMPSAGLGKDSPPQVFGEMSGLRAKGSISRAEARLIPRTSSLDSTLSSVSSNTSLSQTLATDAAGPRPEEIMQLIASAGTAEAAIAQLLKEKKHAVAQNSQLFRLVQKQRNLMSGMKADLDHALQEKEVYRRRLKERGGKTASPIPAPTTLPSTLSQRSRTESVSSTHSDDELPIQRHSATEDKAAAKHGASSTKLRPHAETHERSIMPAISGNNASFQNPGLAASMNIPAPPKPLDDASRTTVVTPITPVAPLEILKRPPETAAVSTGDAAPSPSSFAARRSFNGPRKISDSASSNIENIAVSPASRKGPPAPLNLQAQRTPEEILSKSPDEYGLEDHTDSEYGDVGEVEELPAFERGRKKTREEDDKERELIMLKEQESRSRSKKKTKPTPKASAHEASNAGLLGTQPKSPAIKGFAPISPRHDHLSPHASLVGVLSGPPSSTGSVVERSVTISPPPMSPGLPVSPRPADRPPKALTLPRSPREGLTSPALTSNSQSPPPLSPRPPRHPIPLPAQAHTSLSPPSSRGLEDTLNSLERSPALQPANSASLQRLQPVESRSSQPVPRSPALQPAKSPTSPRSSSRDVKVDVTAIKHKSSASDSSIGRIHKGLVSEAYPDLLLPPNAIPSIVIKVTSSRLKPSRSSIISPKGFDEDPVFTLGVSARSDMKQLWRVEKPIMSLPVLEEKLKRVCSFDIKLPDQSLFTGHSPAKIDARREALDRYFEAMLDTPMNEKAALEICQYLSTQVISAEDQEAMKTSRDVSDQSSLNLGPDGRVIKEGYLTKRGKQFGGWKARFFVLDEPVLRYYDAPGGSLQGTIKLTNAQIGRQQAHTTHSPTRGEDPDSQFRHAFLILEPKKKDSKSHMKHVLCAENDQERDDWVYALLQYVGLPAPERKPKIIPTRTDSDSKTSTSPVTSKDQKDNSPGAEGLDSQSFDTLQGTSYEDTLYAKPPTRVAPPPPVVQTASPLKSAFASGSGQAQSGHMTISRPSNGAVIQDASIWGNKAPASPRSKDKEQKKRSIWVFRDKAADVIAAHSHANSNGSNQGLNAQTQNSQLASRPVFGIPLSEAVQYCSARGSDTPLPSVVYRCIEYLEVKGAANEEGIFRLSGSNVVIKQLKEKFNTEGDFDFLADGTYYDVHAVASLLKLYLRELPSVVLTRELHMEFLRFMELDDKASKIAGYNILVHKLPLPNWTLVRALSKFLLGIVSNAHINKMSVRNVGIVFAPTLSMPAPVFSAFLTDFEAIFVATPPSKVESHGDSPGNSSLAAEDIRSPRRQISSDIPLSYTTENPLQQNALHGETDRNQAHGSSSGLLSAQTSYEASLVTPSAQGPGNRHSVLIPGPDLSATPRTQGAGLGATGIMRDTKARRRESAMMFVGPSGVNGRAAQRKSSMPSIANVAEE